MVGGPAHLLGYSDGAVIALLTAFRRPELVRKLVVVSGVFHRDGWLPGVLDPDPQGQEFTANAYAEISPDGIDHFPVVAAKLDQMHVDGPTLTADDLARIEARTLIAVSDDDEMALEHAIAAYRGIPDAELAVVPGTSHGLMVEKPELCAQLMGDFLATDPVTTFAPIRRA